MKIRHIKFRFVAYKDGHVTENTMYSWEIVQKKKKSKTC